MSEEDLLASHGALLDSASERLSRRLGHRIPAEDLRQYGIIGALKQHRKDPATHYIVMRCAIRAAMIDGIRGEFKRSKASEAARSVELTDLDRDQLEAPSTAEAIAAAIDVRRLIARVTGKAKRRHVAIALEHARGFSQAELGRRLGIGASRVSQIVREAIKHLRAAAGLKPGN